MLSLSLPSDLGAVELRGLEPWQAPEFAAYVATHREALAPWLPWAVSITTDDLARAFLQRYADGTAGDGRRIYGLWLDGRMIGGTLFRIFEPAQGLAEVGVWLSPDVQGHGVVARAVTAMVDWAVRVRGLHRIEWHCVPENAASRAVAARLGMTLEGTTRESFVHAGRLWDTEIWAVLAPEWLGRDQN